MPSILSALDRILIAFMRRWGTLSLRLSLAVVFAWFGLLKPLGLSPVDPLVMKTVAWLPLFTPAQWGLLIGWWEVAIGLAFLHPATTRLALVLLALHLVGTFMPLVIVPERTFQAGHIPYAPTLAGQYIFKNLIVIAAALTVGGTLRTGPARDAGRPG